MTSVDSFKQSMVHFNNQWLLVETSTTKQKLPMPTNITSAVAQSTSTCLEISSSINCTSPDRMEILHNVILNGWLVQTISIFKPSIPPHSASSSIPSFSQKKSNLTIQQESKIQNVQPALTESAKSSGLNNIADEEIQEEDSEDDEDEIIDEENQSIGENKDSDLEIEEEQKLNIGQERGCPQQNIKDNKYQNNSDDQLLFEILNKIPLSIESNQNINNQNNLIKSPKKNNISSNCFSAFSRSTANSSANSSTISKSNKNPCGSNIPAFSCDNIIEEIDTKKRVKKSSILTDDSTNDGRQNLETEDSLQASQPLRNQSNHECNSSDEKPNSFKESKNSFCDNYYLGNSTNSSTAAHIQLSEMGQEQSSAIQRPNSPLRNISSSITAAMMTLGGINDSQNDILQNSSCSQNEDSSNFSSETDKIYNQSIRRNRLILKKAIAKSSTNIDKPLTNISSINNSGKNNKYPRKSSYLNQIKLASSPSLTSINHKRDRKNLVKNFIKAFRGFINNASDETEVLTILMKASQTKDTLNTQKELNEIRKNFEKFIAKKNYNNTLMVELIQNIEFNTLFNHFLQEKAQEWIQQSKIKDKLSHEEALNHYLLSIKDTKALAKVRCLKYRSANNIEEALVSPINNITDKIACDQFVDFQ